jgi:hypothetical protein
MLQDSMTMTEAGQVPPSDRNAEQSLLSSLLLNPAKVNEAGAMLLPSDFYDSGNKLIFAVLKSMDTRGIPIDVITVIDELRKTGEVKSEEELKSYLDRLLIDIASCSSLEYTARILREKANKRAVLNASHELQKLVSFDAPLEEITETLDTLKKSIANTPNDYEQQVYTPNWDNIPPETPSILLLNGKKILSPGNLSLVIAGAGSGKSAVCEAICAASINGETDSFHFTVNAPGMTFYVDTERSKQDHGRSWLRTMKRAGIETGTIPGNLRFELISTLPSVKTRKQYLSAVVDLPDLSLLLLDGLGDFVPDVNDAESSNAFLFWLLSEAKQKGFGILGTLHPNPADADKKGRGHLGSEAMRRAESVLAIAKEGDVKTLSMDFRYGKNRNDADTASCSFQWNDTAMMFLSCEKPEKKPAAQQRQDDLIGALRAKKTVYSFSELIDTISEITGKPKTAARSIYQRLRTAGKLVQSGDLWGIISNEEW